MPLQASQPYLHPPEVFNFWLLEEAQTTADLGIDVTNFTRINNAYLGTVVTMPWAFCGVSWSLMSWVTAPG